MLASSTPPFPLRLEFPPELISLILHHVDIPGSSSSSHTSRNSLLLTLALINKSWASASLSLLHSSLKLIWKASTSIPLLASFQSHPELLNRVRRLEVTFPTLRQLAYDILPPILDDETLWKEYQDDLGVISANREAYKRDFDRWKFTRERHEFVQCQLKVQRSVDGEWLKNVEGPLNGLPSPAVGTHELWALVARLPRLRHLVLDNVGYDVNPTDREAVNLALSLLSSLTVTDDELRPNGNEAVRRATSVVRLSTPSAYLAPQPPTLDPTPTPNPFPNLRHLTITVSRPPNAPRTLFVPGDKALHTDLLDVVLAARDTLQSLTFDTEDDRPNVRPTPAVLANTLALVPNLRSLVLSTRPPRPSPSSSSSSVSPSSFRLPSPTQDSKLLSYLSTSSLSHFGCSSIPTPLLLSSLPTTLLSISFHAPMSDPKDLPPLPFPMSKVARDKRLADFLNPDLFLDKALDDILDAKKERLASLRLVTVDDKAGKSTGKVEKRERRERKAADAGVCWRE